MVYLQPYRICALLLQARRILLKKWYILLLCTTYLVSPLTILTGMIWCGIPAALQNMYAALADWEHIIEEVVHTASLYKLPCIPIDNPDRYDLVWYTISLTEYVRCSCRLG